MLSVEIKEAIEDLRYLLNQGYPRSSAVEFVSDHYQLELNDRHLLARCVFSDDEIREHRGQVVEHSEVSGRSIGIDGYNILITVESILTGERIIKCDDGFIRDLQAIFGKYKMSKASERALSLIIRTLKKLDPEKVVLLFDKQVSKSGELAGIARRQLDEEGIEGNARTTVGTDAKVWKYEVSASSDRVVINKSNRVLDISTMILKNGESNLVDLTKI